MHCFASVAMEKINVSFKEIITVCTTILCNSFFRLLIYMARATSTLPASLFLAQFWTNNAANPFQDYLMTFKRSEENEMVLTI